MSNLNEDYEAREVARLRKIMASPAYWRDKDPEVVQQVTRGFENLYDKPANGRNMAEAKRGQAANQLGLNGTNHKQDTEIAHLTPGEIVIPLSAQTPELMRVLNGSLGNNLTQYIIGSGQENVNPESGLPAFADFNDGRPSVSIEVPPPVSKDKTDCANYENEVLDFGHQINIKISAANKIITELKTMYSGIVQGSHDATNKNLYKSAKDALAILAMASTPIPIVAAGLGVASALMNIVKTTSDYLVADINRIKLDLKTLKAEISSLEKKKQRQKVTLKLAN